MGRLITIVAVFCETCLPLLVKGLYLYNPLLFWGLVMSWCPVYIMNTDWGTEQQITSKWNGWFQIQKLSECTQKLKILFIVHRRAHSCFTTTIKIEIKIVSLKPQKLILLSIFMIRHKIKWPFVNKDYFNDLWVGKMLRVLNVVFLYNTLL